jgi:hypothetical protein
MYPNKTELTYYLDRRCAYCNAPIADQVHALRIFCELFEREDGTIQDCKGLYNTEKNKTEMDPFKPLAFLHRDLTERIRQLYAEKGELVTLETINQYGIPLDKQLKLQRTHSGLCTFYFKFFGFQQLNSLQFKIFSHELL